MSILVLIGIVMWFRVFIHFFHLVWTYILGIKHRHSCLYSDRTYFQIASLRTLIEFTCNNGCVRKTVVSLDYLAQSVLYLISSGFASRVSASSLSPTFSGCSSDVLFVGCDYHQIQKYFFLSLLWTCTQPPRLCY